MDDELDKEMFTCMVCHKQFDHTQGTWPQRILGDENGDYSMDADHNTREGFEFVCYDCLE